MPVFPLVTEINAIQLAAVSEFGIIKLSEIVTATLNVFLLKFHTCSIFLFNMFYQFYPNLCAEKNTTKCVTHSEISDQHCCHCRHSVRRGGFQRATVRKRGCERRATVRRHRAGA